MVGGIDSQSFGDGRIECSVIGLAQTLPGVGRRFLL